ncbi:tryptophan-rich sensory protein [archaeon]|nr:tryptophan-rich sensory protein [archaeon]
MVKWVLLISLVILCNLIGSIGGLWAGGNSPWYKNLNKPKFNPPSWVFLPVWTFLFTLMGIALYFVWVAPSSSLRTTALVFFGIQFLFNVLWSFSFFGLENPLSGLINILVLDVLILITGIYFFRVNNFSGYLFIPYFLWVGFASLLNWSIFRLNI